MNRKILMLGWSACLSANLYAQHDLSTAAITRISYSRNAATDKLSDLHQADFNNDGFTDILADGGLKYNQSGQIRHNSKPVFFMNDRRGNLVETTATFTHLSNSSMISDIADYNNDGFPDILVYDFWANGMRLYKGGAGLNFTLDQTLATGTHGAKGYFEDLDQDGDLDIYNVSSGSGSPIALHIFNNNQSIFSKVSYSGSGVALFAPLVFAKDVNHDGKKDIISLLSLGDYAKVACIWLQKTDQGFHSSIIEELDNRMKFGAFGSLTYAWEDLNEDGFDDLIFLNDNDYDGKVHANAVYSSSISPYFEKAPDISGPSTSKDDYAAFFGHVVISGDIDKDGTMDLITNNRMHPMPGNLTTSRQVKIFTDPFNRKGNFSLQTIDLGLVDMNVEESGDGLLLADLENDNDLELLSLGRDDTLRIFGLNPKTTGISDNGKDRRAFTLFPNPTTDKLYIEMGSLDKNKVSGFKIYALDGSLLQTHAAGVAEKGIDIGPLPQGIYLFSVELNNGISHGKLFSKE